MPIANVVFHAFQAAYISWIVLLPLAVVVLLAEAGILKAFNRDASIKAMLACTIAANVASYVVGAWVSPKLYVGSGLVVVNPDENGWGVLDRGPGWQRLARYSFLQACLVSIVIEAAALMPIRKKAGLRWVVTPVILGNALGYALLALGFVWIFGGWSYSMPGERPRPQAGEESAATACSTPATGARQARASHS